MTTREGIEMRLDCIRANIKKADEIHQQTVRDLSAARERIAELEKQLESAKRNSEA
jgi:hypothetical protein